MEETKKKESLQWHPAFFADLQIELEDDRENLEFENEHQLGTKPKEIDVLIIKKQTDKPVKKNIGRIFQKHNIVEYKSPTDSLSIDDFYKVCGYAMFYKSDTRLVNEIKIDDITITFACHRFPRELMKHLKTQGLQYKEMYPGIYYIAGTRIAMQLLWIPQLSKEENFWLHYLTNQLSNIQQAEELIRKYSKNKDNHLYKSVMDIIVRANRTKFEEAKSMCEALEELMEDELLEREKRGMEQGLERGLERGLEQGLERGLEQGLEQGFKAFIQDNIEENIPKERILQKLVKRFNLTEEKAREYYDKFGE